MVNFKKLLKEEQNKIIQEDIEHKEKENKQISKDLTTVKELTDEEKMKIVDEKIYMNKKEKALEKLGIELERIKAKYNLSNEEVMEILTQIKNKRKV